MLLKEVSLRLRLSPGLMGVPAHSRSQGPQGADTRLPGGDPGGWGGQGGGRAGEAGLVRVSICWGAQAQEKPQGRKSEQLTLGFNLLTLPL